MCPLQGTRSPISHDASSLVRSPIGSPSSATSSYRKSPATVRSTAATLQRFSADDDGIRRAPCAFCVFLPRRSLAARGAGRSRGGARLRGACAHRPRRRLRLARVRARGEGVRRAADHGRRGDARRRLPRDAARRVAARVREPLPAAHRRARSTRVLRAARPSPCRRRSTSRCSRSCTTGSSASPGCARHGLAVRDPNAAARLAQAFGRERFFVELQRPYERGDVRRNAALRDLAETLGVATVVTGDPHAHARFARRLAGRARRDPQPHVARRLRARAARQPRVGAARAGGDVRAVPRRQRRRRAHRRARAAARVRSDGGARLPLSGLLRRRRAGDRAAARALRPPVPRALRVVERAQAPRAATARRGARADRAASGSPGSSSCTGRCSSSRARSRSRCAARRLRGRCCRRDAAAARPSARSSAT